MIDINFTAMVTKTV